MIMENKTVDDNAPIIETDVPMDVVPKPKLCTYASIGLIIVTIALLTLVVVFYSGFAQTKLALGQLAAQVQNVQAKSTQADAAYTQLNADISAMNAQTQEALAAQTIRLNQLKNGQQIKKESWVIAEANYYTKLANANLQVGDNIPLVISLLKIADTDIRDLNNDQLLPLRKALATDIVKLQAVPAVDSAGIYLQLVAMDEQVDKLSLPNKRGDVVALSSHLNNDQQVWWRRGLQDSLAALQKIVVIRYHDTKLQPFISPDAQAFIYQNLHALYAQAMWACLHKQPTVYQASLKNTILFLQTYFIADSPLTLEMLTNLKQLQAVQLALSLPSISDSLSAFQQAMATDQQPAQSEDASPAAKS
jgi:uroporphyrin-3 C-methyltransferase